MIDADGKRRVARGARLGKTFELKQIEARINQQSAPRLRGEERKGPMEEALGNGKRLAWEAAERILNGEKPEDIASYLARAGWGRRQEAAEERRRMAVVGGISQAISALSPAVLVSAAEGRPLAMVLALAKALAPMIKAAEQPAAAPVTGTGPGMDIKSAGKLLSRAASAGKSKDNTPGTTWKPGK